MKGACTGFCVGRDNSCVQGDSPIFVDTKIGTVPMKAVLFGATKGMGRALARLMAARGDRLFLLGREIEDLAISARDLEIRGAPAPAGAAFCDLLQPDSFAPALDRAERELDGFDVVVVTAGLFATQDELEDDSALTARLLAADFTNTVLFCEEARKRLLGLDDAAGVSGGADIPVCPAGMSSAGGQECLPHCGERREPGVPTRSMGTRGARTLCVFSSVAGERGRKPVILYGAAKAGLSRYLEGLDHKFRRRGLCTVCVKPGFVKTGMTAGLRPPPLAATPDDVARRVLRAIDRGRPEVYAPGVWRWIMRVIRHLPRLVMRRIEF
jgi:decaprenylphospho-beta-D-erythro-pentofuranosid-2-ulose 2-reductase